MYNPEYSEVIAYLEYKVINNEATDREVEIYNRGIYGAELSKGLIAKLKRNMNKELVN